MRCLRTGEVGCELMKRPATQTLILCFMGGYLAALGVLWWLALTFIYNPVLQVLAQSVLAIASLFAGHAGIHLTFRLWPEDTAQ